MHDLIHHSHVVRRLYRPDLPAFRDHLVRLDPETRHDRFGLQVSDDYLAHYAELCFAPGAITYGYVEDGLIRGAAELRMLAGKSAAGKGAAGKDAVGKAAVARDGEAAFSVERDWRRRGIGAELMSHIVLAARNRRIDGLTIFCLRHNRAMLALARKFEADLAFDLTDVTGHLVARPPNALSLWREMVDTMFDLGVVTVEYQGRMLKAATQPFS